jgi:glycosyltransferase involved in cell wall biosynthesis
MIDDISVVIIAKNAQATIKEVFESLTDFNEVVLYLNDSSDNTEKIATEFDNVKIVKGKFIGFGSTKNEAAKYAKNSWIFSLDSDEIVDRELIKSISNIDTINKNILYKVIRNNYFLGTKTISKDILVRIYNKDFTKFNDKLVHEKVIEPSYAKYIFLNGSIKHLNITDINQTLTKMIKYTDLGAEGKKMCFFLVVILKASFAFFRTYILKGYILNGWVGFVIATTSANRRFYKYLKQYINCKNQIGKQ